MLYVCKSGQIKPVSFITPISNSVYFNVLNDIVDKYNDTYARIIKKKPIDVKSDSFAEYSEKSNEKDPKFNVGYHVRISKHKNIFAKGYALTVVKRFLLLKNLKIQ